MNGRSLRRSSFPPLHDTPARALRPWEVLQRPVDLARLTGANVVGVDASPDMTTQARTMADDLGVSGATLELGDSTDLALDDNTAEVSVGLRLMNWQDFPLFRQALSELRRTTSRYMIAGIRLSTGQMPFGDLFWRREVGRAGKQSLKAVKRQVPRSLQRREGNDSGGAPSCPSLIDHSEEAVKEAFRRQRLNVVEAEPVLLFRSTSLSARSEPPGNLRTGSFSFRGNARSIVLGPNFFSSLHSEPLRSIPSFRRSRPRPWPTGGLPQSSTSLRGRPLDPEAPSTGATSTSCSVGEDLEKNRYDTLGVRRDC